MSLHSLNKDRSQRRVTLYRFIRFLIFKSKIYYLYFVQKNTFFFIRKKKTTKNSFKKLNYYNKKANKNEFGFN